MMLNFVVKDVEKIKGKTIMRHFKLFLQITLLLNLAFSWGKTGHRTTGEVAEHFLTEKTKIEIQNDKHRDALNDCQILASTSIAILSSYYCYVIETFLPIHCSCHYHPTVHNAVIKAVT